MAERVTDSEVKAILDTNVDTSPFITAASLLVDRLLDGQGYTTNELKEIERWLAAHMASIRDPNLRSQNVLDAAEVKQVGYLGKGLEFTGYGQQVKLLEYKGILANNDGKAKATLKVV